MVLFFQSDDCKALWQFAGNVKKMVVCTKDKLLEYDRSNIIDSRAPGHQTNCKNYQLTPGDARDKFNSGVYNCDDVDPTPGRTGYSNFKPFITINRNILFSDLLKTIRQKINSDPRYGPDCVIYLHNSFCRVPMKNADDLELKGMQVTPMTPGEQNARTQDDLSKLVPRGKKVFTGPGTILVESLDTGERYSYRQDDLSSYFIGKEIYNKATNENLVITGIIPETLKQSLDGAFEVLHNTSFMDITHVDFFW